MTAAPNKLKLDAIVEALFEIQFDHDLMPEIVVGQLAASKHWAGYGSSRQPAGSLPMGLLAADPALRFQPTLQLDRPELGEIVRFGPRVASLHVLSPYPNWPEFLPRLRTLVASLYEVLDTPFIHRAGLRYINALTPAHGFSSVWDLKFDMKVNGRRPSDQVMSGYTLHVDATMKIQMKIASTEFIAGPILEGAVAYVDVDVQTVAPLGKISAEELEVWLISAHSKEKDAFFDLWPEDKLEAMRA